MTYNNSESNYAHTLSLFLDRAWFDIATYSTFDEASAARDHLYINAKDQIKTGKIYIKISEMTPLIQDLPELLSKVLNSGEKRILSK